VSGVLAVLAVFFMVVGAVWFFVSAGALLIGRPAWPALKGIGNGLAVVACGLILYLFATT
jgi:hypothetical protein